MRRGFAVAPIVVLVTSIASTSPARAATYTVTTNADSGAGSLRASIISVDSSPSPPDIINLDPGLGTITLASDLPALTTSVTINGNSNTIDGASAYRGLFVYGLGADGSGSGPAIAVAINDLTIQNAEALGGTGAGGGAGLGGGLFVTADAGVTLDDLAFAHDSAVGGGGGADFSNQGGGGLGGNGGPQGSPSVGQQGTGAGGVGSGAAGGAAGAGGSPGILVGANAGGAGSGGATGGSSGGGGGGGGGAGGGGVGGASATSGAGGVGGFGGGGGGAAASSGAGGAGGFGGGGGSSAVFAGSGGAGGFGGGGGTSSCSPGVPGQGGFGAGGGNSCGGPGGGGLGAGGAIFVMQGGSVTLAGPLSVTGGSVTGGSGNAMGSNFGSGLFLEGTIGTVNFAPPSGATQIVSDDVADQTGSGGTGGDAGSWTVAKSGAGLLTLNGTNTYSGGTLVTDGLLNFGSLANLGTGDVTLDGGGLQWSTGTTTDVSGQLAPLGSGGGTFDTNGNNVTLAGAISGSGGLTKAGAGTLTLTASNSYAATTVTGGLVNFGSLSNLGSGAVTLDGGGLQWAGGTSTDVSGKLALAAGGGTLDTNGNSVTLGSAIGGPGGLTKAGAGTLTLPVAEPYAGPTVVQSGTLNLTGAIGNVSVAPGATLNCNGGTITGAVTNNGGTVTGAPGSPTGLSASPSGTGAATVNFTSGAANCSPITYTVTASPGGATATGSSFADYARWARARDLHVHGYRAQPDRHERGVERVERGHGRGAACTSAETDQRCAVPALRERHPVTTEYQVGQVVVDAELRSQRARDAAPDHAARHV